MTINGEIYKTSPIEIEVTNAVKKPNDPNNVEGQIDGNIHLVAVFNPNPYLNEGSQLFTNYILEIQFQFLTYQN